MGRLTVAQSGTELAYAEVTSNQATSSNSFIDVTGWTITVTSRGRPYIVRAWLAVHATNASAGGGAKYRLVRGDTSATVGECDDVQATAGNPLTLAPLAKRIDVAAGTQITFKVQIASRVAGTVTFTGSADMPLAIQATEL